MRGSCRRVILAKADSYQVSEGGGESQQLPLFSIVHMALDLVGDGLALGEWETSGPCPQSKMLILYERQMRRRGVGEDVVKELAKKLRSN